MPHVALVPFTGLRVREQEMLELGMSLPGLRQRAVALGGLPALGLLTLAGMTPESWSLSYHASADSVSLVDEVATTKPDLVAVSALTASILEAYKFCDELTRRNIRTVIGGLHVTVLPDEAKCHATSVCVGDGESSWLQILADAASDTLKPIYRPANRYSMTDSPLPRFDLLAKQKPQRWTIQTQRGCPWSCEFCGASRLLGPARFKKMERVGKELDLIRELDHSPWVELADDNTLAGRKDAFELLDTIGQHGIKYFTENDWRVGEDEQLVKALANSGCVQVLIGIESLSFRYPGMGRKQSELARICNAIDVIQGNGIVVNGCFIVGADGETNASLDEMIEFINSSTLAEVQLTIQTPFPGTGLYDRMQRDGRLLDRDWSYYTLFDVVFQPDQMRANDLERGFRRILTSVFSGDVAEARASRRRRIWTAHPRIGRF